MCEETKRPSWALTFVSDVDQHQVPSSTALPRVPLAVLRTLLFIPREKRAKLLLHSRFHS